MKLLINRLSNAKFNSLQIVVNHLLIAFADLLQRLRQVLLRLAFFLQLVGRARVRLRAPCEVECVSLGQNNADALFSDDFAGFYHFLVSFEHFGEFHVIVVEMPVLIVVGQNAVLYSCPSVQDRLCHVLGLLVSGFFLGCV